MNALRIFSIAMLGAVASLVCAAVWLEWLFP